MKNDKPRSRKELGISFPYYPAWTARSVFMISTGGIFFLLFSLFFQIAASAKVTPPSVLPQKDLLEVKVYRLIVDPNNMQPIVLLIEPAGDRVMPIWIGPSEANAIQAEMEREKPPRPMTHDLLERVIQRMNGTLKRVIITEQKENIYFAVMVIEKDRSLLEIDARPSDSIVMALKFKTPIYIAKSLFQERAIPLTDQKEQETLYGLTLQELTPMLAESFGLKKGKGSLISDVKEGSRAEKDGFQRGDIVVEMGGEKIEDVASMKNALVKIKNPTRVKIFRKGTFLTLTCNPAG